MIPVAIEVGVVGLTLGLDGGGASVFWQGGRMQAGEFAKALGTTLEKTPVGGTMDFLQRRGIVSFSSKTWDRVSSIFANNATGTAKAVVNNNGVASAGSTWMRIERAILQRNGVSIDVIPVRIPPP